MSRRRRALGFGVAAALAAIAAAAVANGYGNGVAAGYGALRPVVVATRDLAAGKAIDPKTEGALEVREVPRRFAPPGALSSPAEALGLAPAAAIPGGAYLLAAQLRPPRSSHRAAGLQAGRRPVQISVSGADALAAAGGDPIGGSVDVVVTSEPRSGGAGRTYLAAAGVPLLALGPGPEGESGATAAVTLGLTRGQALRLIAAESFARQVTVIPRG